jgi:branched-subunit amino acid transport protein
MFVNAGRFDVSLSHPQVLAALPAFLVAWRMKSLMGTVIAGIAAMALIRLLV